MFYGDDILLSVPTGNVTSSVSRDTSINLRDYQYSAYEAIVERLKKDRSTIAILATGLGKTVLLSKIIQSWKGNVLVLVHLEELLQNAYISISKITGEVLGIERQKEHFQGERILVATYQSLHLQLGKFNRNQFSLIIVDEVHHASNKSYQNIFDYFNSSKLLGLTATLYKPIPQFNSICFNMGIKEGIDQGYLVPIKGDKVFIESVDLTRVKLTAGGDFDESQLDNEMVKGGFAIADTILEKYTFDKGILFFPGCDSAKFVNDLLNKSNPGCSVYVDGKIRGEERRTLIKRLRDGKSNWLCNVGVATEGFDWPDASTIGMAIPTTSWVAYAQRVGRGTRPVAGIVDGLPDAVSRHVAIASSIKPWMKIVDFVGISNVKLISNEVFLSDNTRDDNNRVIGYIDSSSNSSNDSDDAEILDYRKFKSPKITYDPFISQVNSNTKTIIEEFDPFVQDGSEKGRRIKVCEIQSDEMSEKQKRLLDRYKIDSTGYDKYKAQKVIKFIISKGWVLSNKDKGLINKIL